jgi:hypothetical protein
MGFIPGMENTLMKLSRSVEPAPVHICFRESENVELILEHKRTDQIVLWVRGRFGKTADILKSQTQRIIHLDAGKKAPWTIEKRRIILRGRRWKVIPTWLEDS